jgi:cytochrome P450
MIQAVFRPLEMLEVFSQRYGDCFTTQVLGVPPTVIFSHPQAIQKVFTADPHLFDSGQGNDILMPLLGENSLIRLDGDRHQQQRRLLTPPFHGERMRTYGKLIRDITEQVISRWTLGKPFRVRASMQEISLRVILQAVFGLDQGERFQQLRQLISSWLDTFNSPLSSSLLFFPLLQQDLGPRSPWGRFLRQRQQIDDLLYAEIRERRAKPNRQGQDILSLMMAARDEAGQPMTDMELRDELMTLLFAGHETTASALTWALYWIHHLPEVRDTLLRELNNLGSSPESGEVARLPYLTAVCQETLRIYPIALFPFSRIVKSSFHLMGYEFTPGTMLLPCIYLTHHREDLYPEPKRFKPERFLERQFSPYEYFPFGGGSRRCIGLAFAQFEMKLVLATILSRYQLALINGRPVQPIRRGITFSPPDSLQMTAIS